MRGWMSSASNSYLPPVPLGHFMRGSSVGIVLYSNSIVFSTGDYVNCLPDALGWVQYGITKDRHLIKILSHPKIPIRAWAGVLGGTGLTAYFGLKEIGKPKPGDIVVVSAAAGAVGSVVCQLAKNVFQCKVVGIAGGERKCQWLREKLNIHEAVDYKEKKFNLKLKSAIGPNGANIVFDNVGGVVLDSMLRYLAQHARVVLCGAVSSMNDGPGPIYNSMSLIVKSASMTGFTLFDYSASYSEAFENISKCLLEGSLQYTEDVIFGLENAPKALLRLFGVDGGNFGKLIVDLHPSSSNPNSKY